MDTSPRTVLDKVTETLVATQKFPSKEAALWDLARAAARNKIVYYQRRIRRLERKYATDFDTFTVQLAGNATPAQEDDWFSWRSAQGMLADWQKIYQEFLHEHSG